MNAIKDPMLKQWLCARCQKRHKKKEQADHCCVPTGNMLEDLLELLDEAGIK